jgi:hypothetical protein
MEGVQNEQEPTAKLEFSMPAELERAKKGVEDFKKTFQSNWLGGRKILRSGRIAPAVQSMFLGLKPMAGFGGVDREMGGVKKVKFPDSFKLEQGHLYDRELVKDVISKNPDIFDDFPKEGDVDTYMQDFLNRKPQTNQTDKETARVGLLYGFPKDAVLSYVNNIKRYASIQETFRRLAFLYLGPISNLTDEQKDIYRHLALIRGEKVDLTPGYMHNFLDQHEEEARKFLEEQTHVKMTEEGINFMVKNRTVNVHGFNYGTGIPTEATVAFPKKLDELYEKSGMNSFISRTRFLIHF